MSIAQLCRNNLPFLFSSWSRESVIDEGGGIYITEDIHIGIMLNVTTLNTYVMVNTACNGDINNLFDNGVNVLAASKSVF